MVWEKAGSTTLTSPSNDISVPDITDKTFYMILHNNLDNGTSMRIGTRINNDSGLNYAERRSANGGGDNTNTNASEINLTDAVTTTEQWLGINFMMNLSTEEKLQLSYYCGSNALGASNAPNRVEVVSKWVNTSTVLDRWDSVRIAGSGQSNTDSNISVIGSD